MIRGRKLPGFHWRRGGLAALVPVGALLASLLTASPASAITYTQLFLNYNGPIYGYGTRCVDDANGSLAQYNPSRVIQNPMLLRRSTIL